MTVEKREEVVDKFGYCSNCLASSHDLRACFSMETCKKCGRFHHTLLHPRNKRIKGIRTSELRQRQQHRQPNHQHKAKKQAVKSSVSRSGISTKSRPKTTPVSSNQQSSQIAAAGTRAIVDAIKSLANILSVNNDK